MRIVHVMNNFSPEMGYQEFFLTREQVKLGHDVSIVTSDRHFRPLYEANRSLLGDRIIGIGFSNEGGVKVYRLKTLFEIANIPWVRGLEHQIRELHPDIVHVHMVCTLSSIRVALLKRRLGYFKLIYDNHESFQGSRSNWRVLYPLFRWTFARLIEGTADALVGVADVCKTFMNRRLGTPLERITVIPLGADDELFRFDAIARQEIRNQLSLSESDVLFIYTGKTIPEKRLELLIEAVKLMKDHHQLKVLLVGSGNESYIEQLKREIKAENLEGRFIWHDAVPNNELPKFYSAADVGVWPHEVTISVREAMACKLPIIISEDAMSPELVEYDNGLMCKTENPSDLAQQMEKLFDPGLRKEMGKNGRKLIEEKLNWRVIAKQFIDLAQER